MTDTSVTSIIATYQQRISAKPYVPATTYGRPTLGANGVPNKLFRVFLFSENDADVQFLKDVGPIDFSSVVMQMPGYTMQSCGTVSTPLPQARRLHLSAWQKSHTSGLRLNQYGLKTQIANQSTSPIIRSVPPRH
jgi:hypothetical protein